MPTQLPALLLTLLGTALAGSCLAAPADQPDTFPAIHELHLSGPVAITVDAGPLTASAQSSLRLLAGEHASVSILAEDGVLTIVASKPVSLALSTPSLSTLTAIDASAVVRDLAAVDLAVTVSGKADVALVAGSARNLGLVASGAGCLAINGFKVDRMAVDLGEDSRLEGRSVVADTLLISASGQTGVELAGRVTRQLASLTDDASLDALALASGDTSLQLDERATARVWSETRLSVDVAGEGSASYRGNAQLLGLAGSSAQFVGGLEGRRPVTAYLASINETDHG